MFEPPNTGIIVFDTLYNRMFKIIGDRDKSSIISCFMLLVWSLDQFSLFLIPIFDVHHLRTCTNQVFSSEKVSFFGSSSEGTRKCVSKGWKIGDFSILFCSNFQNLFDLSSKVMPMWNEINHFTWFTHEVIQKVIRCFLTDNLNIVEYFCNKESGDCLKNITIIRYWSLNKPRSPLNLCWSSNSFESLYNS